MDDFSDRLTKKLYGKSKDHREASWRTKVNLGEIEEVGFFAFF